MKISIKYMYPYTNPSRW